MPLGEAFLRETIEVWQPLSREPLTMTDAQEVAERMTEFFAVLARCAKERRMKEAQDDTLQDGDRSYEPK